VIIVEFNKTILYKSTTLDITNQTDL